MVAAFPVTEWFANATSLSTLILDDCLSNMVVFGWDGSVIMDITMLLYIRLDNNAIVLN